MAGIRLFALNSENYAKDLCTLIQKYINYRIKHDKAKPSYTSIVRDWASGWNEHLSKVKWYGWISAEKAIRLKNILINE